MEFNNEFQPKNPAMVFGETPVATETHEVPVMESTLEQQQEEEKYGDIMSKTFVSNTLSEFEKLLDETAEEGFMTADAIPVESATMDQQVTTNNLEPVTEQPVETVKSPTTKSNVVDLLSSINIDLNNITISDGSLIEIERTEALLNDKSTMQVVCCQSAYRAEISPLKSQEITTLLEGDNDYYTFRKRITQIAHRHIENTSIGRLNYPSFIKHTSYYDFETVLYGLYCQTFPGENKYKIGCPSRDCGKVIDATASNYTLVESRGTDNLLEHIDDVIKTVRTPKDVLEKSLIHKKQRVCLDETKIIADIEIPTLEDYLERILGKVTPKQAAEYSSSLGIALFINALYIPNIAKLKETGQLEYFKVDKKMEIVKYIGEILPYYDALQLTESINDYTEKYRVSYSLKDVQCPHCGHIIERVELDMEELLFRIARQGRQK